jgi:hypothetical protein
MMKWLVKYSSKSRPYTPSPGIITATISVITISIAWTSNWWFKTASHYGYES